MRQTITKNDQMTKARYDSDLCISVAVPHPLYSENTSPQHKLKIVFFVYLRIDILLLPLVKISFWVWNF